jgi:hypothetical protein
MKFRKVYIEITNRCNLACDFCPGNGREPLFMDEGLFKSLCDQLRGRCEWLHLHVMGEPLLHPRIPEYLDLCKLHGHRVNLVTNGTLLAKLGAKLMAKPALRRLSVSLHSLPETTPAEELHAYMGALKECAGQAANRDDCIVQLRLWNKRPTDSPFRSALLRIIRLTFGIDFSIEERLASVRSFMLGKNLCIDSVEPFEWPSLSGRDLGEAGTCLGLRKQCAILADGTVTPCCLDNNGTLSLGSAKECTLAGILSGERATKIRGGFERGAVVEDLCRRCSYRLRFSQGQSNQSSP